MSGKIQKADPRLRRSAVRWLATGFVVGGLLIILFMDWQQEFGLMAQNNSQKAGETMGRFLRWFAIINTFLLAGLAIWLWGFSRKISASGVYPPPGVSVIRDTEIKTGITAKKYAFAGYCASLFFLVWGGLLLFLVEKILNLLL